MAQFLHERESLLEISGRSVHKNRLRNDFKTARNIFENDSGLQKESN